MDNLSIENNIIGLIGIGLNIIGIIVSLIVVKGIREWVSKNIIFGLIIIFGGLYIGTKTVTYAYGVRRVSEKKVGTNTVIIINKTGYTAVKVYFKTTSDSYSWSDDQIISHGQSVTLRLPYALNIVNRYDIMLVDNEDDTYTKSNVYVSANSRIEFTFDDFDDSSYFDDDWSEEDWNEENWDEEDRITNTELTLPERIANQEKSKKCREEGDIAFYDKNYKKALEDYKKAINLYPGNLLAYYGIEIVYCEKLDKKDDAILYLQDLNELYPDVAVSYYIMGRVFRRTGNYEEAIQYFEKAISLNIEGILNKDFHNVWGYMGDAHRKIGNQAKANEHFQIAKELREKNN